MDPGTRLGYFEIIKPLGAGGMGRCSEHEIPRWIAMWPSRCCRKASPTIQLGSLNRPNIATIHGFDESDGVRFIAMELVEGQSLAARTTASGAIGLDEALEIARR